MIQFKAVDGRVFPSAQEREERTPQICLCTPEEKVEVESGLIPFDHIYPKGYYYAGLNNILFISYHKAIVQKS